MTAQLTPEQFLIGRWVAAVNERKRLERERIAARKGDPATFAAVHDAYLDADRLARKLGEELDRVMEENDAAAAKAEGVVARLMRRLPRPWGAGRARA